MEGRRRRNKKKFSVLGCRIVLWGFYFFILLCELSAYDWGAKNPPSHTEGKLFPFHYHYLLSILVFFPF
jgi:hypothetical protein